MKINRIGVNYTHNNSFMLQRPGGSEDYLLLLVKTPAIFQLQGKEITTPKNTVILFNKNTPQFYTACQGSYANDFIHFDTEGERELRNIPFDTLFTIPNAKQVNRIWKEIYMEFISNNPNKEDSMSLLLRLLLVKLDELIAYRPQDTTLLAYFDVLIHLRSMIYHQPAQKWSVANLSQQANLSPSYFQRLYKQTFGVTCFQDVITSRIEYAKASLTETSESVRDISLLCGFENEEHFMRLFKREVGMTPTQYRKQFT